MNLRGSYQRWAGQWPDESRWLPWIWAVFALFLVGIGWSLLRQWGSISTPRAAASPAPAAAPASLEALRTKVASGAWGPAEPATLDLAFAAVLAGERRDTGLESGLWSLALSGCGRDPARIEVLRRLGQELGRKALVAQADAYARKPSSPPNPAR